MLFSMAGELGELGEHGNGNFLSGCFPRFAEVNLDDVRASAQFVQIVRPILHQRDAVGKILSPVVCAAQFFGATVRQQALYHLFVGAKMFPGHCADGCTKPVWGVVGVPHAAQSLPCS